MKTILIHICLAFTLYGNTQDSTYFRYHILIEKGKGYMDSQHYQASFAAFDSAFALFPYVPYHYFDAFVSAVKASDFEKAYGYLVNGTLHGLNLSQWNTEEIQLFRTSIFSDRYHQAKDSLLHIHFQSIDLEYYRALEALKQRDQADRQMFCNDSLNFEALIGLCAEKGFPTFPHTGYGCNIAWLLLWHHRDEYPHSGQWQRIMPYIRAAINAGQLTPYFLKKFGEE